LLRATTTRIRRKYCSKEVGKEKKGTHPRKKRGKKRLDQQKLGRGLGSEKKTVGWWTWPHHRESKVKTAEREKGEGKKAKKAEKERGMA